MDLTLDLLEIYLQYNTTMNHLTRILRTKRPRTVQILSISNTASEEPTSSSPLEQWSKSLTLEQKDKLIDTLMDQQKLDNDLPAAQQRLVQQEMLRQLAGLSLLRDNPTGWHADTKTAGHFLKTGSTPISVVSKSSERERASRIWKHCS